MKTLNYKATMSADKESPVLIRRTWNKGESKITIQVGQRIKRGGDGGGSLAVALLQGIDGAGYNSPTALHTMAKSVWTGAGFTNSDNDYFTGDAPVLSDLIPADWNIEITRSFTKNPWTPKQEPITNPNTGEIMQRDGKDVYEHKELMVGTPDHQWDPTVKDAREQSKGFVAPKPVAGGVKLN